MIFSKANTHAVFVSASRRVKFCIFVSMAFLSWRTTALGQVRVTDIFGRSVNQHGITLVDWDGYIANPLIKIYLSPPTNSALPGSATISANGDRLYFKSSDSVSTNGPRANVPIYNQNDAVPFELSIFPDRDGMDEDYMLTIIFTDANNTSQTNTVPIHVVDQDSQRSNDLVVTVNFDRDETGVFTNDIRRALTIQAANDWTYFFANMRLDPVAAGAEMTFIWSNNFDGGYYFTNTNEYTGYLLYGYGTTNETHRSGGEGSFAGSPQSSDGVPLTMQRSGGFESEIYGNYNTLGWLYLTNDEDWLITGNLGNETNDYYSIAHHEIGHALIFNEAHAGFNQVKTQGAFTSEAVTNYYGGPVPIDSSDHLNGAIDPESGQGAFGYEYYGDIPRKRWLLTKLDLLCAEEVGYVLRSNSAFAPLDFSLIAPLPDAHPSAPFSITFVASGGIPFYCWDITSGTLPPGLTLDSFTGVISGTPVTNGDFQFSLRVRDYHETGNGITRPVTLHVTTQQPVLLTLLLTNNQAHLTLNGTDGQQATIQASVDLFNWAPIATNISGTNVFHAIESNVMQFPQRFYRSVPP